MKLLRRTNRPGYDKWSVDITPKLIQELGWPEGQALHGTVSGDVLVLRPKRRDES